MVAKIRKPDKIELLVDSLAAQATQPVAYDRKVVAFYDVLGWRQKIAEAGNDPEKIRVLKTIISGWALLSGLDIQNKGYRTRITSFSDNVVISEPVAGPNVHLLLFRLGYFQVVAAWSGLLVRGAVTVGAIVHDENIVFGPALNRAYELESQKAVYPRIILDPDIVPALGSLPPFMDTEDGLIFLDPFTPLFLRNWAVQQERVGSGRRIDELEAATALVASLRHEVTKPMGDAQWEKVDWLYQRVCKAFALDDSAKVYRRAHNPN